MPDLLEIETTEILAVEGDSSTLVTEMQVTEVVAVAEQGPPGAAVDTITGGAATTAVIGCLISGVLVT